MKKVILTVVAAIVLASAAFSQSGAQNVTISTPSIPEVKRFFYTGTNLQYVCTAYQKAPLTSVSVAAASLTNIAVSTNTATATTAAAHGLYPGAKITISGATVDTDLNGSYVILTSASDTTYTFATVAVADATYTDAGLVVSTRFPLYTARVWNVQVFTNISNVFSGSYWGDSNVAYAVKCSDRATF